VHLSDNYNTAVNVGKRHGNPIVLKINAFEMYEQGHKFILSDKGVWLTYNIPVKFMEDI
jgi:putative RNA 2'-phosphotransferase